MPPINIDAIIVGAGFSGIYMLKRCRELGLSAQVIEAGGGAGGTWYWNRYPGARCDVESMTYSYSFSDELQQEWTWTERYARQPEILRYIEHVLDRFDLRRDIQLETRVTSAVFDDATNRWIVDTDRGERLSARFCIMATGCMSTPHIPKYEGLERFEGDWYHTGLWPHEEIDFTGKRVAVIGTGSSGVQSIPVIAAQAAHLTVFQRTPNFSIPAWNGPLSDDDVQMWKSRYPELRQRARGTRVGDIFERLIPLIQAPQDAVPSASAKSFDMVPVPFLFQGLAHRMAGDPTPHMLRSRAQRDKPYLRYLRNLCA